jgi:phosphoserine phosphatase RsbU/P
MQNALQIDSLTELTPSHINRVMVVDDSQPENFRMTAMLKKMGYEVLQASDGNEALQLLRENKVAVVLSDWVMPEMTGLELCQKISQEKFDQPYFIMVSGRDTTADLVAGMNAGADDFIAKPFNGEELLVRLKAGQRTIKMRFQLESQSSELQKHIEKQEIAAEQSKNDLAMASEILTDHLPKNRVNDEQLNIYGFLKPASDIGGDFYNYFKLDENHKGFFLLDVVGHGVPAALFAFMLARSILPEGEFLVNANGYSRPSEVIRKLNNKFLNNSATPQYFTMTYGVINTKTGKGMLCQAGSPHSIILSEDGECQKLGDGGYPVGIIPGADYEDIQFELKPGSRLMLYSDGLIEAENESQKQFGLERLTQVFKLNKDRTLKQAVESCFELIKRWAGQEYMADDISMLTLEIPRTK